MKRSGVVDHVVLMPMRIKTQWEDGKLIAMMPGWQLPPGRFLVEGDNMEDALNKLEGMMRQYWGEPSNAELTGRASAACEGPR